MTVERSQIITQWAEIITQWAEIITQWAEIITQWAERWSLGSIGQKERTGENECERVRRSQIRQG